MGLFFAKHPTYIELNLYMAEYYEKEGFYDQSIMLYEKCIPKLPFDRLLDIKIGKCLALKGNYESALSYLNSKKGRKHASDAILAL